MATLIKTLTLTLGGDSVQAQLNQAELVDEPTTEDAVTFEGTDTFATPNYKLNIGGFQDWGIVDAVCQLIHAAYITDPVTEIAFVLTVGSATRTGTARPAQDVPFGGNAGSPLQFSLSLDVVGTPVDGTTPVSGIRNQVELEGAPDPIEVVYDGRDIRAWEADTGQSYLSTPDTYTQREHLTWYALRRQGLTDLDLDGFRAVCVAVTALGAGDPVGPTQQAPTGEPS